MGSKSYMLPPLSLGSFFLDELFGRIQNRSPADWEGRENQIYFFKKLIKTENKM